MKLQVDATAAINALGIKHHVKFVQTRLNRADSFEDYGNLPAWKVAGVSPFDSTTVYFDPWAGLWAEERVGQTLEESLAHELVHVRQMQDVGDPGESHRLYQRENQTRGYDANRFEIEANQLAPRLAPLVRLEVA